MQLNSIHFDLFRLSVNGFEPIEFRARFHDWDEGHVCALCGAWYEDIDDLTKHMGINHTEWFKAVWLTVKQCRILEDNRKSIPERIECFFKKNIIYFSTPLMRVSDLFDTIYKDLFEQEATMGVFGGMTHFVCKTCGKDFTQKHAVANHVPKCRKKHERISKSHRYVHPLKPWDDPESLFCSPKLKDIIKKEPLTGDECREAKARTGT